MIRSLLKSRSLWQNVRNLSESKTIPPDFIDTKKLSDVIDNAVTEDDKLSTGFFAQISLSLYCHLMGWILTLKIQRNGRPTYIL